MNKGSRDDDTGAELPEDSKDGVLRRDIRRNKDRSKDTDGACHQHDKQQTDAEADVVVPVDASTALSGATAAAGAVSGQVSIANPMTKDGRHTQRRHGSGSFGQKMRSRCELRPPPPSGGSRPPRRWGQCRS